MTEITSPCHILTCCQGQLTIQTILSHEGGLSTCVSSNSMTSQVNQVFESHYYSCYSPTNCCLFLFIFYVSSTRSVVQIVCTLYSYYTIHISQTYTWHCYIALKMLLLTPYVIPPCALCLWSSLYVLLNISMTLKCSNPWWYYWNVISATTWMMGLFVADTPCDKP